MTFASGDAVHFLKRDGRNSDFCGCVSYSLGLGFSLIRPVTRTSYLYYVCMYGTVTYIHSLWPGVVLSLERRKYSVARTNATFSASFFFPQLSLLVPTDRCNVCLSRLNYLLRFTFIFYYHIVPDLDCAFAHV